jgi:dienelactone hydrolase
MKTFVRQLLFPLVFLLAAGCGTEDDEIAIEGPDFPTGPGIVYPVKDVTFTTVDSVEISARYGHTTGPGPNPVVILVHDIGEMSGFFGGLEWLIAGLFERLLEEGYSPLAIDLRGHGNTPYPDDGRPQQVLLISDIGNFHLDVRAALNWLKTEPSADIGRVAIVGAGVGGNVAYVSMGAFPDDLRAGVALSPGVLDPRTLELLAVGEQVENFSPHSMMFLVSENDILGQISETEILTYPALASYLNDRTGDPKYLKVFPGQDAHGLDMLQDPEVVDTLLSWIETHL